VEAYLRMAGQPFETVIETNPLKGPRGRMPFIESGEEVIADSRLILEHLEGRTSTPLDSWLTSEQRAISFAFQRVADQDLIRVILYSRWVDPAGWEVIRPEFAPFFPFGLRRLALSAIRHSLIREARGAGTLELTRDEIYALGARHLAAISDFLGEKRFFLGDKPSTVDATLYGFLSVILETPIDVPLRKAAQARPNLVAFCDLVKRLYFKDI